jgi:hypothetical protein
MTLSAIQGDESKTNFYKIKAARRIAKPQAASFGEL